MSPHTKIITKSLNFGVMCLNSINKCSSPAVVQLNNSAKIQEKIRFFQNGSHGRNQGVRPEYLFVVYASEKILLHMLIMLVSVLTLQVKKYFQNIKSNNVNVGTCIHCLKEFQNNSFNNSTYIFGHLNLMASFGLSKEFSFILHIDFF